MVATIFAAALAAAAAKPAAPPMPKPAAELSVEKWFVGSWTCTGQQHAGPMGPEMKTGSTLTMKMELGGYWLQVHVTPAGGPMKGKEVSDGFATWDGTQHVRYDFNLPGTAWRLTSRGWEGDKMVFDGQTVTGESKGPIRHTITKKGDKEFSSVFEIDGKPWLDETCKKK